MRSRLGWPTAVLFGPALGWLAIAGAGSAGTLLDGRAWGPIDRAAAEPVGAATCRDCHRPQWESWSASYHRTMTQPAHAAAAPFAGETLEALGFVATMSRDADGTPRVRIVDDAGEVLLDVAVELVVGSHRYQQYVARIDRGGGPGELWRLPVAWHRGEARWIHLNGAFLAPDGEAGSRDDYLRHLARYNDNCIFCHNTAPNPGLDAAGHWQSSVAEWGIACEACHGPASSHVERHDSVARRLWSVAGPDGSIADPGALDAARSNDVCGRCHGQRIGHDLATILAKGDGFVPGEALDAVSRPIFRDSAVGGPDGGVHGEFAARFWPDGTPRLSAHEFQGLLLSPCAELTCEQCHDMHGPTPAMQLRRDWDPTGTCLSCHASADLSAAAREGGHGGHGDAVSCVGCHMPRTTYGLLGGIVSHRITSPDPATLVGRHDAPDACTQCHVDRTRAWAASQWPALGFDAVEAGSPEPQESWAPRVVLDLHGGDPIQRALAAHALARPEAPVDAATRLSWIVDAMADDYAAVRWIAWRGARDLAASTGDGRVQDELDAYDPAGPIEARLASWARLRGHLGPGPFAAQPERQVELEAQRDRQAIWIGE